MDEFAYVRAECRFDLVNGPTLHQLPCRDGDMHTPKHTNICPNTHAHTHMLAQIKRKEEPCRAIHLVSEVTRGGVL